MNSKVCTILIGVAVALVLATVVFQALEMNDYDIFTTLMSGK